MQRILELFFSPHAFRDVLPDVWLGFQTNIHMMVVAEILVLIFALGIAVIRGLPGRAAIPLRALAIFYVDFFRGTPLIIVALVIGVGVPAADAGWISSRARTTYGIASITIIYSAYVAEVYRAGIESIHAEPAHGGALARAELRADDALRRAAAGHPARHPAVAERLHRPAEGHGDRRTSSASARRCSRRRTTRRRTRTSPATRSPRSSS